MLSKKKKKSCQTNTENTQHVKTLEGFGIVSKLTVLPHQYTTSVPFEEILYCNVKQTLN